MTGPDPHQREQLRQAALAHARAAAHLAEVMIQLLDSGISEACERRLTVVRDPLPALTLTAVAFAACWRCWCRAYCCACQWSLAVELHPLLARGIMWGAAVGASVTWQLFDYAWKGQAASHPPRPRLLPGSRAA